MARVHRARVGEISILLDYTDVIFELGMQQTYAYVWEEG